MDRYFKPKNQPLLDKYGRVLLSAGKVKNTYPVSDHSAQFPQAEPMFDGIKLREAYEYYAQESRHVININSFFNYLLRLEKDVPLTQQKVQP